jgi:hypothetical protein
VTKITSSSSSPKEPMFSAFFRSIFPGRKSTRLVFSINSGRSGSNFLANLLATCENTVSFHEPPPAMTHDIVQLVNELPYSRTYHQRKFKVKFLRKAIASLPPNAVYCETSHMFIKTFHDVVVPAFPGMIDVILLRRHLPSVLKSFLELEYFSPRNPISYQWMTSPNAATAAAVPLAQDSELDQVDIIIAYLVDIEARAERFQRQFPFVRIHETRVELLNEASVAKKLLDNLDLKPRYELSSLIADLNTNTRSPTKAKRGVKVDLGYCCSRVQDYIERADQKGIRIPPGLALDSIR